MREQDNNSKNKNEPKGASFAPAGFGLKNRRLFVLIASISVVFLLSLGYLFIRDKGILGNSSPDERAARSSGESHDDDDLWKFNLIKPAFAQIDEIIDEVIPSVPFYMPAVNELENLNSFIDGENIQFSAAQKQALEESGFFLADNNIIKDQSSWSSKDDFVDTYDVFDGNANQYYRSPDNTIFVTSDLALHLYHILVDRSFQRMEETKFQPRLSLMTKALFLDSINKYNSTADAKLKESYKRLTAYYLAPLVVLDAANESSGQKLKPEDYPAFVQYLDAMDSRQIANSEKDLEFSLAEKSYMGLELSDEVYELVKSELELMQSAKGMGPSPLFTRLRPEFLNDYSQFKPRSHYAKNDILKSYFIAMMWYGRMGFTLNSPDLTRDALIMTGQINNLKIEEEELLKMWSDMAAVIDFFVGEVDDLTAYEYSGLIKKVYGAEASDESFADDAFLEEFIRRAQAELPAPKIVSEALVVFDDGGEREKLLADTKQFRFMGQRFTPDAYIINNLTQGVGAPDPETGQMLPSMPTALMAFNIIAPDNQIIKKYLDEWVNDQARIEKQGRESDKIIAKVINKLKSEFASYGSLVWTQNIYWSWLNSFKPLLAGYGAGYPAFMQTDSWLKKNLTAALGSFTELKHDTLLYAKQSYAELGGGGENPDELPPAVKGYVEPDLIFWNRIIALAKTTQAGLKDRKVLPEEFDYKYQAFIGAAEFLRQIAEQELRNQVISDEDFEKLRTINSTLKRIADPINGQELTDKEKRAGIIADIHTDALNRQILYEATGKPLILYAAVKDINGARLTRGAVFSHYEFMDKLDERLSDEDWQAEVYGRNGQLPAPDKWSRELVK